MGHNKQAVQKYVQNQGKEDMIDQISMAEYYDPLEKRLKSYKAQKGEREK